MNKCKGYREWLEYMRTACQHIYHLIAFFNLLPGVAKTALEARIDKH